ncbi:unannotated protein [freshwater metagenome]|uniref:Unannotated protein n=1 Tax=freshwater metagenome TaxID=449393 RepID=A0A6J6SF96_9ZZZZ
MRQLDRVQGLGERADLVDLDQEGVGLAAGDAAREPLDVGDEQVVADELRLGAEAVGDGLPPLPVVLVERVLDRDDGVGRHELGVVVGHLLGGLLGALEGVEPALAELRGRDVEREHDVGAQALPGLLDRLGDQVERCPVGGQVGREAALVADAGGEAAALQHGLQCVIDLGAAAHGLLERRRTDGRDHELLDVDVGVGVGAAVEDVHHRHRQHVRVGTADVAVERQTGRVGSGASHGERDTQDGVGAEGRLVGRAVEVEHRLVDQPLVVGVETLDRGADLVDDRVHGLLDALAGVPIAAVAQLHRLERTGRRARRHGGASERAVVEEDLHLDGGVAAGVEDLAGADCFDGCHGAAPDEVRTSGPTLQPIPSP